MLRDVARWYRVLQTSLIKSSFITGDVPHFETVLYVPERCQLEHWYRTNQFPDQVWQSAQVITGAAIGAGAILPERSRHDRNFEVAVSEKDGLVHYWRDNDDRTFPWRRAGLIAPGSHEPGERALFQLILRRKSVAATPLLSNSVV